LVSELKSIGADVAVVDGPDLAKRVSKETDGAAIRLALDMVGDISTLNLMACLAPKGLMVVYSAASAKPYVGSGIDTVFRDLSLRGFWLGHWVKTAKDETLAEMYGHLAQMIAAGAIKAPVAATYSFEEFPEAISKAMTFKGKILFKPNRADREI
jgi:NADPH:quinone reductase-like Zn-dependent oxidoreductase